jgi:hypothetical protein
LVNVVLGYAKHGVLVALSKVDPIVKTIFCPQ